MKSKFLYSQLIGYFICLYYNLHEEIVKLGFGF